MEHNARRAMATPLKRLLVREENYSTTATILYQCRAPTVPILAIPGCSLTDTV